MQQDVQRRLMVAESSICERDFHNLHVRGLLVLRRVPRFRAHLRCVVPFDSIGDAHRHFLFLGRAMESFLRRRRDLDGVHARHNLSDSLRPCYHARRAQLRLVQRMRHEHVHQRHESRALHRGDRRASARLQSERIPDYIRIDFAVHDVPYVQCNALGRYLVQSRDDDGEYFHDRARRWTHSLARCAHLLDVCVEENEFEDHASRARR